MAAAFGAIQHIPRIVPGLSNIQAKVAAKEKEVDAKLADQSVEARKKAFAAEKSKIDQKTGSEYTKVQEVGGLIGRFLLALLAVRIVSRRSLLRIFQLPGIFVVPLVFWFFLEIENVELFTLNLEAMYLGHFPVTTVSLGVLLAGLFTVAQFSFWGNYLPRVYPVHLRGTGESFAANIGGRALGVGFWWVTTTLALYMAGDSPPERLTHAAAIVAFGVFALGSLLCFFLPEPPHEDIAD